MCPTRQPSSPRAPSAPKDGTAICLLTHRPDQGQLEFYRAMARQEGYGLYVFADVQPTAAPVPLPDEVRVAEDDCRRAGFVYLNYVVEDPMGRFCTAWEQALYYCAHELLHSYRRFWIIEEDVLVPTGKTIGMIDRQYPAEDLLAKTCQLNDQGNHSLGWHWPRVPRDALPPPWAGSMVCAVRISSKLAAAIDSLLRINRNRWEQFRSDGQSLFIEFLIPTVAMQHGLSIANPRQLGGITWRTLWEDSEINPDCLYHPLKDRDRQRRIQRGLASGTLPPMPD